MATPIRTPPTPQEWDEIRRLGVGEKIEAIVDRSIDVFQQVGRIEGSAVRAERAADRCESILRRAFPSTPPPAGPVATGHRLQSIANIGPDDSPTLVNFKAEIAPVLATYKWWGTFKSGVIGVLTVVGIAAAIYAAVFKK